MKPTGFAAAHVGMLLWALLIAVSFSAAAQVSQAIDPILLTGLRLLFCALVFLPLLLVKGDTAMNIQGLLSHALLGMLLALYFGSLFEALRYTSTVTTGTMFAVVPLSTLLFEAFLIPDSNLKQRVLPMLTAAAGAVLLVLKGAGPDELPSLYAVSVYGIGCLAMALYSPLSQRLKTNTLKGRGPVGMTFWNMLFGALFLLAICGLSGGWRSASLLTASDLWWLLYLALFATLATFWLLHRAIGVIAPSAVISYIYLSTLFITLFHWFWLRESPLALEIIGALLVGIGMLALLTSSRQAIPAQPSAL
ncbi:drug/metabolite transporter (DMT)-like permease [Pseudomonas sp. Tn43]|uniref:DMT family transporter n=1 Tax=unclassified Pseudomonas TaxID=196821 RepID=UPI000BABBE08|nr:MULTISPECIES: DMT family transporter [unclassified Pseudomonas]MBB3240573.1 drug/metabolite transporter (DMT)-like permease [Pseudomonas sp. Tn43]PAU62294.1 EamA family transporter [Pseudomonas sp. PICF141]